MRKIFKITMRSPYQINTHSRVEIWEKNKLNCVSTIVKALLVYREDDSVSFPPWAWCYWPTARITASHVHLRIVVVDHPRSERLRMFSSFLTSVDIRVEEEIASQTSVGTLSSNCEEDAVARPPPSHIYLRGYGDGYLYLLDNHIGFVYWLIWEFR